ncbi:MAG: 3-deoxy-7-phosphoheptulonate synthase [Acidobacteria bacterium]|nr:MAG: 3-deoxy-7-phosphoheptulonate synthase [Acidobacteriota bacterium]
MPDGTRTPELPDVPAEAAPYRVGYQGQEGAFGARAAHRRGLPAGFDSFERLLAALSAGAIEAAVLPAVNRIAGALVEPLEALAAELVEKGSRLRVVAEVPVPVRLVLAAPRGVDPEEIREVHSQLQILRQCRKLVTRLGAVAVESADTAVAAARVAELGGPRAAVSSEEAALAAGLVLLEEDVSDVRPNVSRFWLLERTEGPGRTPTAARTGADEAGLDGGFPLPPPPEPRVVLFRSARQLSTLSDAGAEVVTLPGDADVPVRGFAIVPEKACGAVAAKGTREGEPPLVWLGPPPEFVRPPRIPGLPRATEVKPPVAVAIGPFAAGAGRRAVIAGPCAVESPEQVLRIAKAVARAGATALRGGVFKPRTSPYAFQGHGLEGLRWLRAAGDSVGLPIVTEVMAPAQVEPLARLADVLQIGARNSQNFDLLREAGGAGRPVLLKRGFGTTVEEWLASAEYVLAAGCRDLILCERGIRTFERTTRGTLDLGGMLAARSLTSLPLIVDPSHAAGRRDLVVPLARAAWGAGADGLIVEVHDTPEAALSDGAQALLPADLEALCDEIGVLPGEDGSVERVRTAIDAVDREISALVSRRLELCRRVAGAKRRLGRPIRDEAREATVKARFAEALGGSVPETGAERLADALIGLGLHAEGWPGAGAPEGPDA